MKLPMRKQEAAYRAIHDAIMDLRIALHKDGLSARHDTQIAQLEHDIWKRLLFALDVLRDLS